MRVRPSLYCCRVIAQLLKPAASPLRNSFHCCVATAASCNFLGTDSKWMPRALKLLNVLANEDASYWIAICLTSISKCSPSGQETFFCAAANPETANRNKRRLAPAARTLRHGHRIRAFRLFRAQLPREVAVLADEPS